MTIVNIENFDLGATRKEFRDNTINLFLNELPGTGKGDNTSKYEYITKTLIDGRLVFLRRPAQFNNGLDFTINVSETNFNAGRPQKRATTRPTHTDIIEDLQGKLNVNPLLYASFFEQIERLFNCQDITQEGFEFNSGHPSELILECIKWLLIEQDVTYWNYSGRIMFFNALSHL